MKLHRAILLVSAIFCALSCINSASAMAVELPVPKRILAPMDNLAGISLGTPVALSADTLSFDEDTGVATAEGNVEVGFGNRTMKADRIRYDSRSGEIDLSGHVSYKDEGDGFSFDRITLNIDSELGVLYRGTIHISSNNYTISSDRFEKTGPKSFLIQKGTLTTCPCPEGEEPDWKFEIRRSTLSLDGYAFAKDVTFRVRGVPVVWLPWAALPVKLSRQSGFLLPSFTQGGSKGFSFVLPYYWAISKWSDATFSLEYMTARGFRPEAEYRYVLNPKSEGITRGTIFNDTKTGETRYRLDGENVFRYGDSITVNAKWDVASDDQYYVDLVDTEILRTARHVPSRFFASRSGESDLHSLYVAWGRDVQGALLDNTAQRLPEYAYTALPRTLGKTGVDAYGDAGATYFFRKDGESAFRARGSAGLFRPFTLYPSVSFTPYVLIDLLETTADSSGTGEKAHGRALPVAGGYFGMELRKDYRRTDGSTFVHAVKPTAGFRWIPLHGQDEIPLDDQWSRVGSQAQFTFALAQRLLRVREESNPVEVAWVEIEWAIDIGGRKRSGSPFVDPYSPFVRSLRDQIDLAAGRSGESDYASSDVYVRFGVRPLRKWTVGGEALLDPNLGMVTTASANLEWKQDPDNLAGIGYGISRDLSEDVNARFSARPVRFLGLQGSANYSIRNGELTEGTMSVMTYPRSDCWGIGLGVNRKSRPEETSVRLTFSLKGIGGIGQ